MMTKDFSSSGLCNSVNAITGVKRNTYSSTMAVCSLVKYDIFDMDGLLLSKYMQISFSESQLKRNVRRLKLRLILSDTERLHVEASNKVLRRYGVGDYTDDVQLKVLRTVARDTVFGI